jgi:hypothetical protein
MTTGNGCVKWWQLVTAFCSLLGIFVTITIFFANHVIANDRLRESGDNKIRSEIVQIIVPRLEDLKSRATANATNIAVLMKAHNLK